MNTIYINQLTTLRDQINEIVIKENTNTINIKAETVLELIENCLSYEMCLDINNPKTLN